MPRVLSRSSADMSPSVEAVGSGGLQISPPKLRRRPAVVAAAVALTCLGALLTAWTFLWASKAEPVVAMRADVQRGEVIARGDLVVARINPDPALHPVPASEAMSLVGQRASMDLPAGTLITRGSVTAQVVPAAGKSVVGLGLEPGLLPAGTLSPGDRVRVVGVPRSGGTRSADETPALEVAAEVSSVHPSSTSNTVVVDVIVAQDQAAAVAARAAAGEVAIVLDSRER